MVRAVVELTVVRAVVELAVVAEVEWSEGHPQAWQGVKPACSTPVAAGGAVTDQQTRRGHSGDWHQCQSESLVHGQI